MSIFHDGHNFKVGTFHGAPIEKRPQHHTLRRFYFGRGVSTERSGGPGSREITIECWINDSSFTTTKSVYDYMHDLDRMTGQHGILRVEFQGETIEYLNTTFDGAERLPVEGREHSSPIPDPVGSQGVTPGSYWQALNLMFTQLYVRPFV